MRAGSASRCWTVCCEQCAASMSLSPRTREPAASVRASPHRPSRLRLRRGLFSFPMFAASLWCRHWLNPVWQFRAPARIEQGFPGRIGQALAMSELLVRQHRAAAEDVRSLDGVQDPQHPWPGRAHQEMLVGDRIGEDIDDTRGVIAGVEVGIAAVQHDMGQLLAVGPQKLVLLLANGNLAELLLGQDLQTMTDSGEAGPMVREIRYVESQEIPVYRFVPPGKLLIDLEEVSNLGEGFLRVSFLLRSVPQVIEPGIELSEQRFFFR